MQLTSGERLQKFISVTGKRKGIFAEELGVKASQLSRYLGERGQLPQREVLEGLAALGCNLHWLITGEGGMFAENPAGMMLKKKHQALGKEHEPQILHDAPKLLQQRVIYEEDLKALETLLTKIKHSGTFNE